MTSSSLPEETRVGRVALTVTSLPETTAFYRDVVGLAVLDQTDDAAVLGAGDTPLLQLREDPGAAQRPRAATGLFHLAVRVPDRAALADALDRVRERWALDGASDHRVSEALYLTDPEGNGLEIYRDRPREEWPTSAGRVRMDTLQLDTEALAAAARGDESVPADTDVGHVHLEVSSIPTAREFYVDALGLGVRQAFGEQALFVAAGEYHHHVGLNTWNGRTDPPSGRGLDWVELVVPTADALRTVRERLTGAGHAVELTSEGVRVVDGDGIELRIRAH